MINWLPKLILLILRYEALVDESQKHSVIRKKKPSEKGCDIEKKIPNTSGLVTIIQHKN